jgi:pilus assembly protein CpaF
MGEIRGPEAKDLLLSLSTGHKGAMATIHARNPHEALMRLEILIQLGAPMWRTETVRKLIFHGIQYIILTQRENHQRRFAGAYRISSLESSGFLLDREF